MPTSILGILAVPERTSDKDATMDLVYRFDPCHSTSRATPPDAAAAARLLEEGNLRFCEIAAAARNSSESQLIVECDADMLGVDADGRAQAQSPFAVVVGCSDARVPTELVFQRAANDLFVVRVAGCVLGDEGLGSVDYAVEHLGKSLRLVVVLGHLGCGAVSAAVDVYLQPMRFQEVSFTRSLRSMIYRLVLPVRGSAKMLEDAFGTSVVEKSTYREALGYASVWSNAAEAAYQLQREISNREKDQIKVVYGVYDIATNRVGLPSGGPGDAFAEVGLLLAPRGPEDFVLLREKVLASSAVQSLNG
jgi:carbonic anhydrase